jgi:hypothetical protein
MLVTILDALDIRTNKRFIWASAVTVLCLSWTWPTNTLLIDKPLYYRGSDQNQVAMALFLRDSLPPNAKIAEVSAGLTPWIATNKRFVHVLGFNDPYIAHLPAHRAQRGDNPYTFFLPGHLKFDPFYMVVHDFPEVLTQMWGQTRYEKDWAIVQFYYSPHIITYDGHKNIIMVRNDLTK